MKKFMTYPIHTSTNLQKSRTDTLSARELFEMENYVARKSMRRIAQQSDISEQQRHVKKFKFLKSVNVV